MRTFFCLLLFCLTPTLSAQDWTAIPWPADWIGHPTAPATGFAVVHFRREFTVDALPDSLPVMVSADNRYQLFVNGQRIGEGPARGDLQHWRYETYDLRPYIQQGENVIAAIVWNYGIERPWSQQSYRTAFVLQPQTKAFAELKTDANWQTYHNEAYSPITGSRERLQVYIVIGPQLRIDGNKMPWGWEQLNYDASGWKVATPITRASPAGVGTEYYWGLVPRTIPMFPREQLDKPTLIEVTQTYPDTPPAPEKELLNIIPPNTERTLLFRFRQLENAFHTFTFAKGKGASIRVEYAESMFAADGGKGDRNEFAGKSMLGVYDEFIHDGNTHSYTTPWFRTARYLELTIKTTTDTVVIDDILSESFVYPFEEKASFLTPNASLRTDAIWDVAWQTARMCAQETYVDCPYYEQLQYVGDTRIQALISLYVTGDDRLMRKAIRLFEQSRTSEGLTQSRYPSAVPQVIPPYSLSWIEMVGDYWMHRPDTAFVRQMLPGVRSVLEWYDAQRLDNGLVGPTKHWNFVDWTDEWVWNPELRVGGVPDMAGGSSIISLQYLSSLRRAEAMFRYFGDEHQATKYKDSADRLATAIHQHCWNADRGLYSDTPKGESFSQHANILAILNDLAPAPIAIGAPEILDKVLEDESLTQISEYFRFYLIQAMDHLGRGDLYPEQLKVWAAYLDQGFTTFPEKPGRTRSDCHAWSASPNYDLLATLAGIRPGSPGYKTVKVRPAYTDFDWTAEAVHPSGMIKVKFNQSSRDLFYQVTLPPGTSGQLEAEGQVFSLVPGFNKVTVGLE